MPLFELGRARPGRQPAGAQRLGDRGDLLLADRRRLEAEHPLAAGTRRELRHRSRSRIVFSAFAARAERILPAVADGEHRSRPVRTAPELLETVPRPR